MFLCQSFRQMQMQGRSQESRTFLLQRFVVCFVAFFTTLPKHHSEIVQGKDQQHLHCLKWYFQHSNTSLPHSFLLCSLSLLIKFSNLIHFLMTALILFNLTLAFRIFFQLRMHVTRRKTDVDQNTFVYLCMAYLVATWIVRQLIEGIQRQN